MLAISNLSMLVAKDAACFSFELQILETAF